MAKRQTSAARVRQIKELLRKLLPDVLKLTGCAKESEINAKIGSRYDRFVGVRRESIGSPDEFASAYLDALRDVVLSTPIQSRSDNRCCDLATWYQDSKVFREYIDLFLERSFLKSHREYSRVKPATTEDHLWIGQNDAEFGLFVVPRFSDSKHEWENDQSEIRKFKPKYFTIGHVLESGLVVPGMSRRRKFETSENYLDFFLDFVRQSGSVHQDAVAYKYVEYVTAASRPDKVPLLIPELRYRGRDRKHKYRLDFCVIDPYSMQKVGFELSPWSSHGRLTGTGKKTVRVINEEAKANFEKEIAKCEAYFRRYGIHVRIFSDSDLADSQSVFDQIATYLTPEQRSRQLLIHSRCALLDTDIESEVVSNGI